MNTPYLLDELVKHKVPPADSEAEFKTLEQKQRENTIANLRRKCDSRHL